MNSRIQEIARRFQDSLEQFVQARHRLENTQQKLLQELKQNRIHPRTDLIRPMNELYQLEQNLQQVSKSVAWLLEQSFELARTSALISSSLQLHQIIEEVMDTVVHITNADRAYLMLHDQTTGKMSIAAARNWERENLSEDEIVFSKSIIDYSVANKEAVITSNAVDDERFQSAKSILTNKLRSVMCIPLVLKEEVIGVLYADNPVQKGIFLEDHLPIMVAFAQQAAITIENAKLYNELERANRHLAEANRLKSEFLGLISHELRSPFSSIGFSMQLFERYGMDNLSPDQRGVWDDLVKGIRQAQQQTNNLVTYAGLFSKQGQLTMQEVNLTELINQVAADAQPMLQTRGITLSVAVPDDLEMPAGDYERLSEAVWHLTQNAIQYNNPGGRVTIRAQRIGEAISIEVEDTGVGIAPEYQERIWEAFEQITDSLKRGVEGLGLGLALVRYVAMAHGGDVTLVSTPGEGSTFSMILPLSPHQFRRTDKS
jgi:signal transduction histidine kinase